MSLADLTIAAARDALASGAATPIDLLDACLERAALTEAELHAYLTLDREGARVAAEESARRWAAGEPRGPLDGIPVALKDNMCVGGVEMTCGSQMLSGYRPPYDATAVVRLREAGATILGKTNLDEFAMGSSTENSAFGPTRNPWDTERVPGGSSGGSAAAVAVGSAFAAFGSDTGGSIRQPAALTGVVGVKPTYGTVSRYGLVAFASSLDQIGPFARTVGDAALLLEAVAGHDPLDATSWAGTFPRPTTSLTEGVSGMRIGVVSELFAEGMEPDVARVCRAVIDLLAGAGAEIVDVSVPSVDAALSAYYLIAPAEASANLARFDGIRYGLRVAGATTEEMMARTRAEGFGPEVVRRILLGTYALSAGYYDAFYGKANGVRGVVRRDFARAYERVDVLVSPTSPTVAFPVGSRTADPLAMYLSDVCTIPSNLAGHPAMSVPVGFDGSGLPVGFQIMAPALGEEAMFRVGAEVERLVGSGHRPAMVEALT